MGGKQEVGTGVEGGEHVDGFNVESDIEESASVEENREGRSLETGKQDLHK